MLSMSLRLTGTRPLLMHHGRLADARNEATIALRNLRRGPHTEASRDQADKLEWLGGLYTDLRGNIVLMEDMILAACVEGAKYIRRADQVRAAVVGAAPYFALEYEGPKDLQQLYATGRFADRRGVKTARGRVMRTRPRFDEWTCPLTLIVDESVLDPRDVVTAFEYAGRAVGIGDFRPRFGRFDVELI